MLLTRKNVLRKKKKKQECHFVHHKSHKDWPRFFISCYSLVLCNSSALVSIVLIVLHFAFLSLLTTQTPMLMAGFCFRSLFVLSP